MATSAGSPCFENKHLHLAAGKQVIGRVCLHHPGTGDDSGNQRDNRASHRVHTFELITDLLYDLRERGKKPVV
jgi:hypothetical protein